MPPKGEGGYVQEQPPLPTRAGAFHRPTELGTLETHKKPWDGDGCALEDSNCAHIGSEEDKAVRKASALTEKAWEGAGKSPGIQVWRIEQFHVKPWPKEQHGLFFTGDSYIILETFMGRDEKDEELSHHIFFWLGKETSIDEKGTAAYKTVELDAIFDGKATQHREVQGSESSEFRSLFKKTPITYLEGGVDSGFHKVGATQYIGRLLMVRRLADHTIKVKQVPMKKESLNHGDSFLLDMGALIYVWTGKDANSFEKHAANIAAENIENTRFGHAKATHEIDEKLPDGRSFWDVLGGEGDIKEKADVQDDDFQHQEVKIGDGILYRLSDESGTLKSTEVARGELNRSMLVSDDVMMLDTGVEIFLWIGKGASQLEQKSAFATGLNYLRVNNKPEATPIHLYKEGQAQKNPIWRKIFPR